MQPSPSQYCIALKQVLDGFHIEGKPLKASIGTTKYCAYFLKGTNCPNPECFYLHEFDKNNEVINKGDNKLIFD
jgi:CCR4-NOT transcription complex subunit 4